MAHFQFKKVVSEMGIPEMRFHDLRHSFAVMSLQNGDNIKTVQENLGHHSASFTLDTYCHITEKMRHDSARRMEDFIQRLKGQEYKNGCDRQKGHSRNSKK